MTINIQQTLHGYEQGHQLLASSTTLSPEANKTLLFQSDLSGSFTNENFATYITGYPIKEANLYAFSRTWYAQEMKRPGCVWTHTLLIRFPDLGKIPDFNRLLKIFTRPILGQYQLYQLPIKLEFEDLLDDKNERYFSISSEFTRRLYNGIYNYPSKSILITASSPKPFETDILNLWSNQWPRLRRNFFFCSGALNLKKLEKLPFDLQVIPTENERSIFRNNDNLISIEDIGIDQDWSVTLETEEKNKVRKFLWTFGSDIEGSRMSFKPLTELFRTIKDKNLEKTTELINLYFPEPGSAKKLKGSLYGADGLFFEETEIIDLLARFRDIHFLSEIEINLEKRILELFNRKLINVQDLIILWERFDFENLTSETLSGMTLDQNETFEAMHTSPRLIDFFVSQSPNLFLHPQTWKTDFDFQKTVLYKLDNGFIEKNEGQLVEQMLLAESDIIFDLLKIRGKRIIWHSLDWFNHSPNGRLKENWLNYILKEHEQSFIDCLEGSQNLLTFKSFALAFSRLPSKKLFGLRFSHLIWIKAYNLLNTQSRTVNKPYIATNLLTIGFKNSIKNAEWLVATTFKDVYNFAATKYIDNTLWNIIPKEYGDDFDNQDFNFFESILDLLKIKPKKKHQIESWDYCEYLIRTLVNKTIMYNWNPEAFLVTLEDPSMFYRAIDYAVTSKKGLQLTLKTLNHIVDRKIQYQTFQLSYLKRFARYK